MPQKNVTFTWLAGALLALVGFGGRYVLGSVDRRISDVELHQAIHDKEHGADRKDLEKELSRIREAMAVNTAQVQQLADLFRYQYGITDKKR